MIIALAQVQMFILAFTRIMAAAVQVPVLAGRAIPNRVRVPLGILLTMLLIPWTPLAAEAEPLGLLGFGAALAREFVLGWAIGFVATLTFGAIQTAGEYVSTGGGFAAGRVMNPAFDSASTALDQLYLILASLIFLTLNGHHLVLLGLAGTFRALPVAGPLPTFSLERLLMLSQSLLTAGLTLALPVLAASLMADLTLGLLARVAPQIQVFFLEGPLKVAIVLVTLIASLGVIVPGLTVLVRDIGPRMQWLVGI